MKFAEKFKKNRYNSVIFVNHPIKEPSIVYQDDTILNTNTKDLLRELKKNFIHENLSKNKKDHINLINHFRKRLEKNNNDLDITISLGNCLKKIQNIPALKKLYTSFNEKVSGSEIIKKEVADIFFDERNFFKAIQYYLICLKKSNFKLNRDIYIKLCYSFYQLRDYEKSSKYALDYIGYYNEFSIENYLLFGNAFLKARMYNMAIKQFQNGIKFFNKYSQKIKCLSDLSEKAKGNFNNNFRDAVKLSSPYFIISKLYNNIGNAYNKIGNYKLAETYLTKAMHFENNSYILNNLALSLKAQGKNTKAINFLLKASKIDPNSAKIYFNLAETYLSSGDKKNTIECLNKTIEIDPNHIGAKFKKNILLGNFFGKIPRNYLERHFDNYSETFDEHLIKTLQYNVPTVLSQIINSKYPEDYKFDNILDLGCGTGLCGLRINKSYKKLVGLDISKHMLLKAKEKLIYTDLFHLDIIDYCNSTKDKYELIIAGDVLIYFGDLHELFKTSFSVMQNGARFLFSIEVQNLGKYKAQINGRFTHSFSYIKRLCKEHGFFIEFVQDIFIRKENNKSVDGKIFSIIKK